MLLGICKSMNPGRVLAVMWLDFFFMRFRHGHRQTERLNTGFSDQSEANLSGANLK